MALRFFAIVKSTSFQGKAEEFQNVYCYDTSASTDAAFSSIIDGIVTAEKNVHGPSVSFIRASVYTTIGLNGLLDFGTILYQKQISGVGNGVESSGCYKECAVFIKWPLPPSVDILGRSHHRELKKWIHGAGAGLTAVMTSGATAITGTSLTLYQTYAAAVSEAVDGSPLCSPGDGTPNSASPIVKPYLEHRQFPRGRKES